jgi:hypothetical protein
MRVRICVSILIEVFNSNAHAVSFALCSHDLGLSLFHYDPFLLAGIIADSIGGIVTLRSRPILASQSGLFCSSTSNAITSFADVYSNPSIAPSAFSFVNASSLEYLISAGTARVFSPANRDVMPVSQSLTALDLTMGFNLALSVGLTFAVQCETALSYDAAVAGCALNNR